MKVLKTLLFLQVLTFSFGSMAGEEPTYSELENRVNVLEQKIDKMGSNHHRGRRMGSPFMFDFSGFDRVFEGHNSRIKTMLENKDMSSFSVDRNEKEILIKAKLPNMTKDDIGVSVENDVLTIKSKKQESKSAKDEKGEVKTSNYRSFLQQVSLPKNADVDDIDTSFKKEELLVTIPLDKEFNKVKKIKIK
jgi:HSP20 family molecular chaperone IbpA